MNDDILLQYVRETLEIEINAAQQMLESLDDNVILACRILLGCNGKVIVSGIGKSGHIAKKIAASLASTGTPAFFVHPTEALHGDLGMIEVQDVVMFISYSGRACEIISLIPFLLDNNVPIIALTGDICSPLAKKSNCVLNIKVTKEACPIEIVPTSSTVNTLMMGDALTIALMRYRGFGIKQFARFHPGGRLGVQLSNRVYHVMRTGEQIAQVYWTVKVMDAMFELSRTGLGLIAVCDDCFHVLGVFTDGDLRRWLVQGKSLEDPIVVAMTKPGYYISKECQASVALQELYIRKITAAPVVDEEVGGILVGSINVYDLHQAGIE